MKDRSANKIDRLRLRIKKILHRSFDWVAWQRALEATFVDEYLNLPGSRATYCLDNSLIIEYLLPTPLKTISPNGLEPEAVSNPDSYPRPRDLALLLLFDPARSINILPPHRKEFEHKVEEWKRRLEIQRTKLDLFQLALDRLIAVIEEKGNGVNDSESDWLQHFIDAVLSEESGFGGILALETQGARSVASVANRLRVVAQDSLAIMLREWKSSNAADRIEVLYKALSLTSKGSETPFTTRVDAHALYLLEQENSRLPEDRFLILLTESSKIWSYLSNDEQRKAAGFNNRRGKVWLIQTPEVELVSTLVGILRDGAGEKEAGEREVRRELILDLEQNKRLREIRDEIEHRILPHLTEIATDAALWQESKARVQELEDGLKELKSVYQNRDRLRTLSLGMDARETWGGALFQKLRSLRKADQGELRSAISSELEKLRNRVCDLEQQMVIASPPPPDEDVAFDVLGESFPELQGVVRSQAEGTAYFIRFQSQRILGHLQRIESLLGQLDHENEEANKAISDRLNKIMRDAKGDSFREPEYHLMLAAIYASRGLWFEAYVAADQGLRRLGANSAQTVPEIRIEQVRFETQLIKGATLQHWALARYGDLPKFAGQFLGEAAECVRKALEASAPEDIQGPLGSREDPRALRELATIFGNAREVEEFSRKSGRLKDGENLMSLGEPYFELAGLPTDEKHSLLALYRALAERAYDRVAGVPSMRVYFVNTFLFALVEEEKEDSVQEARLAHELEALIEHEEQINFLDTLAWFHYRRAKRIQSRGGDYQPDFLKSRDYIGRAKKKVRLSKNSQRFYEELLRSREKEIESLNPQPSARGEQSNTTREPT